MGAEEGMPGVVMPAFGDALSDADIARIAAYLRRTRTNLPPWPDLWTKIAEIRREQRRQLIPPSETEHDLVSHQRPRGDGQRR
jgi:hypothetical protein